MKNNVLLTIILAIPFFIVDQTNCAHTVEINADTVTIYYNKKHFVDVYFKNPISCYHQSWNLSWSKKDLCDDCKKRVKNCTTAREFYETLTRT